jgi:exodeoxyribonuclease V beta subunit
MSAPMPFNPATMPLDGIRLVEASAGTGKTHSLAGLYLRLIVEKDLDVREILVMTFTRAASQELRERLRERLAHAATVAARPAGEAADNETAFAEAVIAGCGDRATAAARWREAATRIDQATITTIHGFAQRAAGENAFESSLPFDRGDQADDRAVQAEAAADYWRERVFADDAQAASALLELWPSPEQLTNDLAAVLSKPHARLRHPDPGALSALLAEARACWPNDRAAFVELLERARDEDAAFTRGALKGWLEDPGPEAIAERIDRGLAGTSDGFPALPAIVSALGDDEAVATVIKKKPAGTWCRPQDLASMPLLATLRARGRTAAIAAAADAVKQRANELKRQRRLYSFQDMIDGLYEALAEPTKGPPLASALRRTWPWALVDEFQDTDPLQYAILRRLYADDAPEAGGLMLIGDPKQAIYGFRGGDVFAYLAAAAEADAVYSMATNFRSAPAVLDGLDAIFRQAPARPFVLDGIDYRAVTPAPSTAGHRPCLDGAEIAGLTAWAVPEDAGTAKEAVQGQLMSATVARIAELLDSERGQWLSADGATEPVRPSDIAVLVNTNREAAAMQAALNAAGVAAVCIQPASVFAQSAARDIQWLLEAAALPFERERLRRALTTPLFGYRLGDLIALESDSAAWATITETFQAAHRRWARLGVQAMAEPFLQSGAARVMTRPDGERCVTNYLHILERLQAAEHEVFGMSGLIRWLSQARRDADEGEVGDAERVRLDNDGDLVRVTTVHKAKGLEFAIVFVPYAPWLGTGPDPGKPPRSFHDADQQAVVDLGEDADDADCVQARREHRAEQVRSLYVALTRAEQACFFAWGALNAAADSGLAWLLHQGDGASDEVWHGSGKLPPWLDAATAAARLDEAARASGQGLRVCPLPIDPPIAPRRTSSDPAMLGDARQDLPAPRAPWAVVSFTGLAGRLDAGAEPVAGADDVDEPAEDVTTTPPAAPEVAMTPRGPGFGQAVHDLFETEPFAGWYQPPSEPDAAQREIVAASLRRHGIDTAADPEAVTTTAALVGRTVHTPLPGIGTLAGLAPQQSVAEMAFFLRLGGARGQAVTDAMREAGYGPRGGIEDTTLRGLMQGFIDLVVEVDGRYWVLDYKTNALGPQRRDYAPEALAAAMRAHHYDLQYLIYTVALHRHLRQRLPGYRAATHLGGAQYLFVRAMDPAEPATGVYCDQPDPALIEHLDALFDGPEQSA